MHSTGSSQTTKSHPQVQKHNAETKTATRQIITTEMQETYPVLRLEGQSMCNWCQKQEIGYLDT